MADRLIRTELCAFRALPAEAEVLREAAALSGTTLSEWMRAVLLVAAQRRLRGAAKGREEQRVA